VGAAFHVGVMTRRAARKKAMRRTSAIAAAVTAALVCVAVPGHAANGYPRTLVAEATAASGPNKITAMVTIKIDRLVEPTRRQRVLDGLKFNGYQGFMNALRPLPVIGSIATPNGNVKVRYAWETTVENRNRLIVVADKPLFFLPADSPPPRAGYELTFVELLFDESGAASGTMSGAARVKPAPDGIVLDDFAAVPVTLIVAAPGK
jgi:hypothetical protein